MRRKNQSQLKFGTAMLEKDGVISGCGIQQEYEAEGGGKDEVSNT